MFSLFIFLIFFIAVAYLFDCYCFEGFNKFSSNRIIRSLDAKSILFISLIVLVPTILVGFRSENTGVDTARYIELFFYPKEYSIYMLTSSKELLFWGIYLFCQEFGDVRSLFFVLAFIPLFFAFAGLYKFSRFCNPFVSSLLFLLFFYNELFNATRQFPAIALIFFSYSFCISRKLIPFLSFVIAASLFHSTAIVALPIYFLYPSKKLTAWNYFNMFFFFIFVLIAAFFFLKYMLKFDYFARYAFYQDHFFKVTFGQAFLNFFINYFPLIFLMSFFSFSTKMTNSEEKKIFSFLWTITILFCLIILLRVVDTWFFRVAYYYQLGEILIISAICAKPYKTDSLCHIRYSLSQSDIMILLVIVSHHFYHNMRYYELSALTNFSLAG